MLQQRTQNRSRHGHHGYPAVADPPACRQTEGEHPEDRTVGIARHLVDQIDDAVVGPVFEGQDHGRHPQRHPHVHALAQARQLRFVPAFRPFEDVHREGGRQRRERRSRRRIGARYKPHNEQNANRKRQPAVNRHQRKELIALRRERKPRAVGVEVEQHPQHQKEEDHEDLAHGRQHDVLLRVARRGAAQIPLHHVLVEARHGHQQHDPRREHLPEVTVRRGVVEEENTRHRRSRHLTRRLPRREAQRLHDEEDRQHEAPDQAQRFERIGPDQRLHPAPARIEPHEEHRDQGIGPERNAVVREDQQLQHRTHHVDPKRCAQHLRNEEEPRPGAVRGDAETGVEVFVERDNPQAVERRDQDVGHDELAHRKARYRPTSPRRSSQRPPCTTAYGGSR